MTNRRYIDGIEIHHIKTLGRQLISYRLEKIFITTFLSKIQCDLLCSIQFLPGDVRYQLLELDQIPNQMLLDLEKTMYPLQIAVP